MPTSTAPHEIDGRPRTGPILAVVSLALMTVVSAVSGLNVALPDLARETGASQTEIAWIVDAYTVVFAGLLLFAGALGDRFGRRELLVGGLAVFGLAAGLGMLTSDPAQLDRAARADGDGRGRDHADHAVGDHDVVPRGGPAQGRRRRVGVAGGGAVLGLFGSGILLEFFSWSSFFGLNVALAAAALIGALVVVPRSVDADPPRLDLVGALLSLVAVAGTCSRSSRARSTAGTTASPWPPSPPGSSRSWRSCCGSSGSTSPCSTPDCSATAASAPGRSPCWCSSSRPSACSSW